MTLRPSFCRVAALMIPLLAASAAALQGQSPTTRPTLVDLAYDDADSAQKLDVYLTRSGTNNPVPAMVYIHGGGWRAGSKNRVPGWLIKGVQDGTFSVVSVEYRFTDVAPHPAQVNDCLRAIQFVRSRAKQWAIDPTRIGVTGGSAGGHLSLWVATHDDVADAASDDPVKRQSSRVQCAVSFAGPTDWSLLGELEHKHPAYRQLLGYEPGTPASEMDVKAMQDVSPITFVSADDPPTMLLHGDQDNIVPIQHARNMLERLKAAGVQTELIVVPGANHGVAGAGPQVTEAATKFVKKYLLSK